MLLSTIQSTGQLPACTATLLAPVLPDLLCCQTSTPLVIVTMLALACLTCLPNLHISSMRSCVADLYTGHFI